MQGAGSGGPFDYLTRFNQSFGVDAGADLDGDNDTDGFDFLAWQRRRFFGGVGSCWIGRSGAGQRSYGRSRRRTRIAFAAQLRAWWFDNATLNSGINASVLHARFHRDLHGLAP